MRKRTQIPDPSLDRLEELWWNENAEIVEAVWAQPLSIREGVRSHYLMKAKKFFLDSDGDRPIGVLEVGCGSGWVGRMIAEPETIKIIGIDLSQRQIEIARENALKAGLDSACEYHCQNLADFVVSKKFDVACVLIHAIVHHLSWQEIHTVLREIASLGKGTRVFVYEPIYLEQNNNGSVWNKPISKKLVKVIANIPSMLGRAALIGKKQYYDQDLAGKVQYLCEQARKNAWVLSPKEVVFQESEFLQLLGQYFDISDRYLCNHTSFTVGQLAAMYKSPQIHNRFRQTILPLAIKGEQFLFKTGLLAEALDTYVFMGYECVVK